MTKKSSMNLGIAAALAASGAAVGWLVGMSVSPVVHIILGGVVSLVAGLVSGMAGLKGEATTDDGDGARKSPARFAIDPRPVALMLVGLAAGSALGIHARTNGWFSTDLRAFVRQWSATGLPDSVIARRLFDGMYPPSGSGGDGGETPRTAASEKPPDAPPTGKAPSAADITAPATAPEVKAAKSSEPAGKSGRIAAQGSTGAKGRNDLLDDKRSVLFSITQEDCDWMREARNDSADLVKRMTTTGDSNLRRAAMHCKSLAELQQLLKRACARTTSR